MRLGSVIKRAMVIGAVVIIGIGWGVGRSAQAQPSAAINLATTCVNRLGDSGFEDLYSPWAQSFSGYTAIKPAWPPPAPLWDCPDGICNLGSNGPAGPRNGANWAWFGGGITNTSTSPVTQIVSQAVLLPPGATQLQFHLWISRADPGATSADRFRALIGSTPVFTATAAYTALYASGYTPVTIDISAFATGLTRTVVLSATTQAASTFPKPIISFNVDDVSVCSDAPSPTLTPTLLAPANQRLYLPFIRR